MAKTNEKKEVKMENTKKTTKQDIKEVKKDTTKTIPKTSTTSTKAPTKLSVVKSTKDAKKTSTKSVGTPQANPQTKLQKIVVLPNPKTETKAETKKVTEQVQEAPKTEVKTKAPKAKSAGATIRDMFFEVLDAGLIAAEQMEILTSAEKTKEVLKIRYAFLKEATSNPDDRKVNGQARYNAKPVVDYNGKTYWITNDLYARNVETFKAWIDSLKKSKK